MRLTAGTEYAPPQTAFRALEFPELRQFGVSQGRTTLLGEVQPRQRPLAIRAFRVTQRLAIRRFTAYTVLEGKGKESAT